MRERGETASTEGLGRSKRLQFMFDTRDLVWKGTPWGLYGRLAALVYESSKRQGALTLR